MAPVPVVVVVVLNGQERVTASSVAALSGARRNQIFLSIFYLPRDLAVNIGLTNTMHSYLSGTRFMVKFQ
jgi:hypothetical protein